MFQSSTGNKGCADPVFLQAEMGWDLSSLVPGDDHAATDKARIGSNSSGKLLCFC